MPSPDTDARRDLRLLARLHGLEPEYWDVFGQRRRSPEEAVLAVLRSLGAPVETPDDCRAALRQRRAELWNRRIEPVVAVADGPAEIPIRHGAGLGDRRCHWTLTLESGRTLRGDHGLDSAREVRRSHVDGREMVSRRLTIPHDLPAGYHHLDLRLAGESLESLLICAPRRIPGAPADQRDWGLFAPLYALRSEPDRGIGSYTELDELARLVDGLGGASVATLPLLPVDADALGGPSPYAPVSRLFWGEQHLDLQAVPELRDSPEARRRLDEAWLPRPPGDPDDHLVDYRSVLQTVRRVLAPLAARFLGPDDGGGERRASFDRFLEARPEARDYARFRALTDAHGKPWQDWPSGPRERRARPDDYDEAGFRTHLYAQWLAHEQLGRAAEECEGRGGRLYLDLPLGVPGDSYDVWRHRESFCREVAVGAPPDTFFLQGQNWAFPPLHPQAARERHHGYFRACLRHHLSVAGMLRVDHVMGLHRLYWIPRGFEATEGVYVRYPSRELWATLRLEADRAGARVVGEDLGTVPTRVRRAMEASGAHRMFVVQTEVAPHRVPALDPVPRDSVTSVNTHDMPTFAGFWEHRDLDDLRRLGHLDEETHAREAGLREARKRALVGFLEYEGTLEPAASGDDAASGGHDAGAVLRAVLRWLADSRAPELIVNFEDLWLEPEPQNVPGTSSERPNWRRRLPRPLAELATLGRLRETLAEIDRRRRAASRAAGGDDGR